MKRNTTKSQRVRKAPRACAALLGLGLAATVSCGDVPVDVPADKMPVGVVRGTVTYSGARPCSKDGKIVGNVVLFFFDRRNPPPPRGVATTPLNFGVVTGERLFVNEPRNTTSTLYCPKEAGFTETITASATFAVSPLAAGEYIISAFYDAKGVFAPTFKIRNGPRAGDVGGGYLDTVDALSHAGDVNYLPRYYPVTVGTFDGERYRIPEQGYVRDNVAVAVGQELRLTRPYFWLDGAEKPGQPSATEPDANYAPVVTMTQDHQLLAVPPVATVEQLSAYQAAFVPITMRYGVPDSERAVATSPTGPFLMQLVPAEKGGGIYQWYTGRSIPETSGASVPDIAKVPGLWPRVVLSRLRQNRTAEPQEIVSTDGKSDALVLIEGLTLYQGSLLNTALKGSSLTTPTPTDSVTALVRPSALCFKTKPEDGGDVARAVARGGLLVVAHLDGPSVDPSVTTRQPLVDPTAVKAALAPLVAEVREACLPKGRYAINLVYPTGQAWTVPNEAGRCAESEGPTDFAASSCKTRPRPILYSQGTRAVLQIVDAKDPTYCTGARAVPTECSP